MMDNMIAKTTICTTDRTTGEPDRAALDKARRHLKAEKLMGQGGMVE